MDPIFNLVAAYHSLPKGWGFPALPKSDPEPKRAKELREALFPYDGDEGVAQLVRWYYGIIRAYPAVAMGIGEADEVYDPGLAWKSPLSLLTNEVELTSDPRNGVLEMLWEPGDETEFLVGTVEVAGPVLSLVLDGETYPLSYDETETGICSVTWPEFLKTKAAFSATPTASFPIVFRPLRFNAASLIDRATPLISASDLTEAGIGEEWSYQSPEKRLALVWAVMQNLRHGG